MSNQDTQNEKEIEARIHEILIAFPARGFLHHLQQNY